MKGKQAVSASELVLSYGAVMMLLLRKTNPFYRRRGDIISKRMYFLVTNENLFMGHDRARNQDQQCWRAPVIIYWPEPGRICPKTYCPAYSSTSKIIAV